MPKRHADPPVGPQGRARIDPSVELPAMDKPPRCAWADGDLMTTYHDLEWGVPIHDDARHFELLTLEGAQAGLSWQTILQRREAYRRAFVGFDVAAVAAFSAEQVAHTLENPGVIRNRAKILSTVANARAFLQVQWEYGSFDTFVWRFVADAPHVNAWRNHGEVPAVTDESKALSRALGKLGFSFVGPKICYAYMQSAGLVNDHTLDCFLCPATNYPHPS